MRIRRKAALFLAATFATGLGLGLPQIAQAAVVPDPSWNEIIWPDITGRSNVMCLDDPGGSTQEDQFLWLWHCHGSGSNGAPQRWQFIPVATDPNGRTAYIIRNTGSHLCLDIGFPIERNPPPSTIFQRSCPVIGSSNARVWIIRDGDPIEPAKFELELANIVNGAVSDTGLCLQAANTSDANGTGIGWDVPCAQFNEQLQMLTLG